MKYVLGVICSVNLQRTWRWWVLFLLLLVTDYYVGASAVTGRNGFIAAAVTQAPPCSFTEAFPHPPVIRVL